MKKKNRALLLFIIIGAAVLLVVVIALLIGTRGFGFLPDKPVIGEGPSIGGQSAPATDTPSASTQSAADPIVGTWKVETLKRDGELITWEEYEEYLRTLGSTDTTMEYEFVEGGTVLQNFMGMISSDTWVSLGEGKYVIYSSSNDPLYVELIDGKLILTQEMYDTYMSLIRTTSAL